MTIRVEKNIINSSMISMKSNQEIKEMDREWSQFGERNKSVESNANKYLASIIIITIVSLISKYYPYLYRKCIEFNRIVIPKYREQIVYSFKKYNPYLKDQWGKRRPGK